jgi:hypothetical protein
MKSESIPAVVEVVSNSTTESGDLGNRAVALR